MPDHLVSIVLSLYSKFFYLLFILRINEIRKIFKNSIKTPNWLGYEDLKKLQQMYSYLNNKRYINRNGDKTGRSRAIEILKLLKTKSREGIRLLELGCGSGLVCYYLNLYGLNTIGIDISSKNFNKDIWNKNRLIEMDASNLTFEDNSFDFVFSFDSFEHFYNPEKVLKEAIRVIKKDRYLFLSFGPLYMSALGLHAFKSINIPFCQFLFPEEMLIKFSKDNEKVEPLKDFAVNKWSLNEFRNLWMRYSNKIKKKKYEELYDISHIDLIKKYPSCFRSKTNYFDNLLVGRIRTLFKKITS